MKKPVTRDELDVRIVAAFEELGNKLAEIAAKTDSTRSQVYYRLRRMGLLKKPLAHGSLGHGREGDAAAQEGPDQAVHHHVRSEQHFRSTSRCGTTSSLSPSTYDAKILVGTFTYNQNRFGELSVKRGTKKASPDRISGTIRSSPYFSTNACNSHTDSSGAAR
jgi:hypothetical protein